MLANAGFVVAGCKGKVTWAEILFIKRIQYTDIIVQEDEESTKFRYIGLYTYITNFHTEKCLH